MKTPGHFSAAINTHRELREAKTVCDDVQGLLQVTLISGRLEASDEMR